MRRQTIRRRSGAYCAGRRCWAAGVSLGIHLVVLLACGLLTARAVVPEATGGDAPDEPRIRIRWESRSWQPSPAQITKAISSPLRELPLNLPGATTAPAPRWESVAASPQPLDPVVAELARLTPAEDSSPGNAVPPFLSIESPPSLQPPPRPATTLAALVGTAAIRVSQVTPDYPRSCLNRAHEGVVELLLDVDAEGRVTGARVISRSSCRELDAVARRAAFELRYQPATRNGVAVAGKARWRVRFQLEAR
jgi:TonB family protein